MFWSCRGRQRLKFLFRISGFKFESEVGQAELKLGMTFLNSTGTRRHNSSNADITPQIPTHELQHRHNSSNADITPQIPRHELQYRPNSSNADITPQIPRHELQHQHNSSNADITPQIPRHVLPIPT